MLRDAIGTEHFTNLLNLYQGSALSIVIDTTGSMQDEINTVKEEAKLIVQKSHPELYVFVPYGDPGMKYKVVPVGKFGKGVAESRQRRSEIFYCTS